MAKIGIITYHFVLNYGAALQAWALQKSLEELGHQVYLIDYRPSHLELGGEWFFPRNIKELKSIIFILLIKFRNLVKSLYQKKNLNNNSFCSFQDAHFNLTPTTFTNNKELQEYDFNYDFYICGSDQIWNSSKQYGIDRSYFLNFVKSGKTKLAYAPSFGKSYIESSYIDEMKDYISKFDYLSAREKSGVKIIKELTDKDACFVVDPTLLLGGNYQEAILPSVEEDFIFSYTLRNRDLAASVEKYVCKKMGLSMLNVEKLNRQNIAVGPLEWLGYFKAAKFIITNSYHGTIFSIIFNKPFIFVSLTGAKAAFNERSKSLLKNLGLCGHVVSYFDKDTIDSIIFKKYSWETIKAKINIWRQNSRDFLEKSIC